jgi:hypothetical protein
MLTGLLVAPAAVAQQVPVEPQRYSGAFRGLEAGAGPAFAGGATGLGVSVAARFSTVLHLADVTLAFDATDIPDADLTVNRLGAGLQLHPLSFFLLKGDGLGAALASLYLRAGFAPSLATAGGDWEPGATWDWGVGLDVPLAGLDAGASWWIGAQYLRTHALDDGPLEDGVLQNVHLRIGYRSHGL